MISLRPQIIRKNGREEFAVLPYAEFLKILDALEDYEDLRALREATAAEKDAPTVSLAELRKTLRRRTSRRVRGR